MAREHPRYEATEWPEYEFREFPMVYYPTASDQMKPYDSKGKRLDGVTVQNQEELDRLLSNTAELQRTSSPGLKRVQTVEDAHAEAVVEAGQLGVKIDRRWGLERIQKEIATEKRARELARASAKEDVV